MKRSTTLSIAGAGLLACAGTAAAQVGAPIVAATGTPARESTAAPCELHVFPTENYIGINTGLLSGFGALGAVADMAAHKDRVATTTDLMKDYLGPEIQVEELNRQDLVRSLGLAGEYRVIVEAPMPSHEDVKRDPAVEARAKAINADIKAGRRLTASTNTCYAEFIVFNIFYHKAAMYGSNLFVPITLRDYGNGLARPVVSAGAVKNPLEDFPPKTPEMVDAAKVELRSAFAKDFVEWTQKKLVSRGSSPAK